MSRRHSPLWWAEIKAGRLALALVALLAAGTAATAAAVPAKIARSDQWVLTDALDHTSKPQRDFVQRRIYDSTVEVPLPAELQKAGEQAAASLPKELRDLITETDVSVTSDVLFFSGHLDPVTQEIPPVFRLVAIPGYDKHVTFVAGSAPVATTTPPGAARVPIQIAVSAESAARFHLAVGSVITSPSHGAAPNQVHEQIPFVVSGVYRPATPRTASEPLWSNDGRLFAPERSTICKNGSFDCDSLQPTWLLDVFVAQGGSVISADAAAVVVWEQTVDPARVRSGGLDAIAGAVRDVQLGRAPTAGVTTRLETDWPRLVTEVRQAQWSSHVVSAVVLGGAAAGGFAALVLVLGMAVNRRARFLTLAKARGAADGRLAARHAGQIAGTALAAGLAGAVGGARWAGGGLGTAGTWYGAAAVTVAAAVVVARLVWRQPADVVAQRGDRLRGDAGTRRIVRDAGIVLAAGGAVAVYRWGGTGDTTGSIDWLAAAAPALLALAAGTVAVRLVPLLLGPPARLTRRGRGTVGFVGTALAGRRTRAVAAPLTGLVIVIAAGMFAAGYDASVAARVDDDAVRAVGAAAKVVANPKLDSDKATDPTGAALLGGDAFALKAAALPGARHATAAWLGMATMSLPDGTGPRVTLTVVDDASFRAVADDTAATVSGRIPRIPAAWPGTAAGGGSGSGGSGGSGGAPQTGAQVTATPAAALASPGIPCVGRTGATVQMGPYKLAVTCVANGDVPMIGSESVNYGSGPNYLVIPRSEVQAALVDSTTSIPVLDEMVPNSAWISGDVTREAVRALPGVTDRYRVELEAEAHAAKAASGQVKAARDVFHLVEALCAGYLLLCLVLLLAATGGVSRDSALLTQVFGLGRRRSRLIRALVPAPIALIAVAAGIGTGLALSPLLGPLTRGTTGPAGTGASTGSVLATTPVGLGWAVPAALAVVALVTAGIVTDLIARREAGLSVRLRGSEYD